MLKVEDGERGEKRIPHLVTSGRMRGTSGIGKRRSQIAQGDDLFKGRIASLGSFSLPGAQRRARGLRGGGHAHTVSETTTVNSLMADMNADD